mgnify:CR=1 FL=1
MNTKKILVTLIAFMFVLTGCSFNKNKDAIVEVNDKVITKAEFEKSFNNEINNPVFKQLGLSVKNKNSFLSLLIKGRVINNLIVESLVNQEIEKRNIKVSKKDVDAAIKNKIEQVGSKAKFNEILKQNGITPAQYKKELTRELELEKLVGMIKTIKITEDDARRYYKANESSFKYPEKVRASHILIAADEYQIRENLKAKHKDMSETELDKLVAEEMQEKLKDAEKVLAQVKKDPTSFKKIAREVSDDKESAKQGGDLGFFASQEMVEPFSKTAFNQKPNTISDIVKTQYGYHIIMVTDRKAAGKDSFDSVKQEIMMKLEQDKKVEIFENFIEEAKKNAKIEYLDESYNPEKLTKLLQEQATTNPTANEEVNGANHSATPAPEDTRTHE